MTAGNLRLPDGVGSSWAATSTFSLTATTGTQLIKCNGKTLSALILNGSGGTFQLEDNLTITNGATANSLTLTAGTFDGQTFTITAGNFVGNNTNTRALQGSGLWTLNNLTTAGVSVLSWVGANLTVSSFTSDIVINANCTNGKTVAFGAYTVQGAVTFNLQTAGTGTFGASSASTFNGLVTINGAAGLAFNFANLNNTFNGGLTFVGPLSIGWSGSQTIAGLNISGGPIGISFLYTATQTLSGTISIIGTGAGPIGFMASTFNSTGAAISMASGTPTFGWCAFRDMAFSGGATFAATNSFDLGHNTGITITPPPIGISRSRLELAG